MVSKRGSGWNYPKKTCNKFNKREFMYQESISLAWDGRGLAVPKIIMDTAIHKSIRKRRGGPKTV